MQKVNEIQNVIAENNGFIPSHVLAEIIDREHANLTKKMKVQFEESTLVNFTTVQESYNDGKNTRTVYMLPEREAMALAMSYDVMIGMQVYEAYQAYKAALAAIIVSESHEDAIEIARRALAGDLTKAMKEKDVRNYGRLFRRFYNEYKNPHVAFHEVMKVYLSGVNATFDKDERAKFFTLLHEANDRLMTETLKGSTAKNYDANKIAMFVMVGEEIQSKRLALTKGNLTRTVKKKDAVVEVAKKAVDIAKSERRQKEEIIKIITPIM